MKWLRQVLHKKSQQIADKHLPIEVEELDSSVKIKASLPGVEHQDVTVQFGKSAVKISVDKSEEVHVSGKIFDHKSSRKVKMSRTVKLPAVVDRMRVKHHWEGDVLVLKVDKE